MIDIFRGIISRFLGNQRNVGLLIGAAMAAGFLTIPEYIVNSSIQISAQNTPVVTSLLELVALLLPALAIVLQVSLKYVNQPYLKVSGQSVKMRKVMFGIVGLVSYLLLLATTIIIRYISLPRPLYVAAVLISVSVAGFALIPLLYWGFMRGDMQDSAEFFEISEAYIEYSKIDSLTEPYEKELADEWYSRFDGSSPPRGNQIVNQCQIHKMVRKCLWKTHLKLKVRYWQMSLKFRYDGLYG